jgi:hypothetical protein
VAQSVKLFLCNLIGVFQENVLEIVIGINNQSRHLLSFNRYLNFVVIAGIGASDFGSVERTTFKVPHFYMKKEQPRLEVAPVKSLF